MTRLPSGADHLSTMLQRRAVWIAGCSLVAVLTVLPTLMYVWIYTLSREIAWDEGYLMITMRGFLDGHALYDDVFTQYGPAYYFLRYPIFALLGVPLEHDATRLITMLTWLTSAALVAWGVWRATCSRFLAWFGFMQAVVHLTRLAHEPGHPQELVVLLMCGVCVAIARLPAARWQWILVAVLTALIALIKINVGLFILIGLGIVWLSGSVWMRPGLARLAMACAIALPFVLMRHHLHEAWALTYGTVVAAAFGSVAGATFALRAPGQGAAGLRPVAFMLTFIAVSVITIGATLSAGSSVSGILQGLILGPLEFPEAFAMPLQASAWAFVNACVAIVCCVLAFSRRTSERMPPRSRAALKLIYGAIGSAVLLGVTSAHLLYLAPWMWIALMPVHAGAPGQPEARDRAASIVLCCIAAPMLLQAYPVAGSQVAWATLLLIPLYARCLRDAASEFAASNRFGPRQGRTPETAPVQADAPSAASVSAGSRHRGGAAIGAALLLGLYPFAWLKLPGLATDFEQRASLDLPGSDLIRPPALHRALYRGLTAYLTENSDGFVTYPGFHSFHFWTGIEPATQINVTFWDLLGDGEQTRIADALGRYRQPRIVLMRDHYLVQWRQQAPHLLRPFQKFVLDEYKPLGTIGQFIVLAPKRAASDLAPE